MITWAVVITAFIVAFVNKLVEGAYGQALVALICGGILTAAALHSKTWLRKTNPNWMFAAALALLFAIISAPWVEQKRWPFSAWFYDRAATEAREETLIAWLQQDQRERDEVRQDLGHRKFVRQRWSNGSRKPNRSVTTLGNEIRAEVS